MKFKITNNFTQNIYTILRRCGYMPIHDRKTGKDSFARKLSGGHYPRFHLYLSEIENDIIFDLHLDQNENRYEGQKAHNADYESNEVKEELIRIYQIIKEYMIQVQTTDNSKDARHKQTEEPTAKKSWLKRLFS